jgi:hypothetical protein
MATKNDITGDSLVTKASSKEFDTNFSKIEPSCFPLCKELQGSMRKCLTCEWKVEIDD